MGDKEMSQRDRQLIELMSSHREAAPRQPDEPYRTLRQALQRRPFVLASRPALLIVDLQGYFCNPQSPLFLPAAPTIVEGAQRLMHGFVKLQLPIFMTRHVEPADGVMRRWWGRSMRRDDPYNSPMLSRDGLEVVEKSTYDAFYQTDLADRLQRTEVDQLVIVGLLTHLCVDTTVRSAFAQGFDPVLPVDLVATRETALQVATLTALAHGFATLTSLAELERSLCAR